MILSIGNSGVYEVESFLAVLKELERKGLRMIHFKQDKCLDGEYLVYEIINGKAIYSVIIDGEIHDVNKFSAIWYMKPHLPRNLLIFEPAEYRHFIQRQFKSMRTALWSVFKNKKWIDDPWLVQIAEDKIYQLHVATQVGFTVPDTLITSDPSRVKEFYKIHKGNIVVKLLSASPMIDKVLFTSQVTSENLETIESVKSSPSIFQKRISKKYELRITVVGDKMFPVKIHSQEDVSTSLDWRTKPKLNDFEVKMENTEIPPEIEFALKSFMKRLGLRFGCIDMIVDKNGDYVFLEINPNGQWYFVQLRTEAKIAKAIANLLIQNGRTS